MKKKYLLLFIFLASGFLLSGMARAPKGEIRESFDEQIKAQASQALGLLRSNYEAKNLLGFMELIDKNFENRLDFQSRLQDYFIATKESEVIFIVDSVLTSRDRASVRLNWLKKSTDDSGAFSKSQGSCQFVFNIYPEGLKLLYIRKDNPFF